MSSLILKVAFSLALLVSMVDSSNKYEKKSHSVLISVVPFPGHYLNMMVLGDALKDEGHNVTFLFPQFTDYHKPRQLCEEHGFKYIPVPLNFSYYDMKDQSNSFKSAVQTMFFMFVPFFSALSSSMDTVINNELDVSNYDVVVLEESIAGILACRRNTENIRMVSVSSNLLVDPSLSPSWPFPNPMLQPITHDMTFTDRFIYTVSKIPFVSFFRYIMSSTTTGSDPDCWERRYNNYDLPGHAVPLIALTVIGFEYPRTDLPLVHYVGPLIPTKPDPLPTDIESWLNSKRERSVVYISMGSVFTGSQRMARAFISGIPANYSVLWSANKNILKGIQLENNNRFLIKSWIPQISALSHSSISLAILHGGAGGVHQSLYHGVPMIIIPFQADQPSNGARVKYWKLGVQLDHNDITEDDVRKSVLEVESGSYRDNAQKMSIILKNAGGVKRAAELIELYARVGYDHLVPAYVKYHWSWIQYYNVDVQVLLILVGVLVTYLTLKLIKCMCKCCCCSCKKQKQE